MERDVSCRIYDLLMNTTLFITENLYILKRLFISFFTENDLCSNNNRPFVYFINNLYMQVKFIIYIRGLLFTIFQTVKRGEEGERKEEEKYLQ